MSTKFFVYATSILFVFGCGESVSDTPQTSMDPMEMMNTGPAPDENGRIELTPCDQATAADLSACAMSIYQLKDQGQALEDLRVSVQGVVTSIRLNLDGEYSHLTLQVPTNAPDYSGEDFSSTWVYLNNADSEDLGMNPPAVGSYIQIIGSIKDHFGQRQLQKVEQVIVLDANEPLTPSVEVQPSDIALNGARAWALEGSLVTVRNVEVTNNNPMPGPGDGAEGAPTNEFEITGGLIVNDFIFSALPQPSNGDSYTEITGFLRYANNMFKLEPRNAQDIR